jgi:hypothetical protein
MKTLAVKTNKNNIKYALIQEADKFGVWKLCSNYCRHAKGGIAYSWRYVERNMTLEDAKKLFTRRSK